MMRVLAALALIRLAIAMTAYFFVYAQPGDWLYTHKDWTDEHALLESDAGAAAGLFAQGTSPIGTLDQSGNVWEWTLSKWQDYPYAKGSQVINPERNQMDEPDDWRISCGGAFLNPPRCGRCAFRGYYLPHYQSRGIGFRVVVSLVDAVF